MNSIVRAVRLQGLLLNQSRAIQTSASRLSVGHHNHDDALVAQHRRLPKPENFDPNNYSVPLRQPCMEDLMEPYGSWQEAYEKERITANKQVFKGLAALTTSIVIFFLAGTADGLMMPNLDNLMEETEPWNFDKEGRITV